MHNFPHLLASIPLKINCRNSSQKMAVVLHGQVSERDHEETRSVRHAPEHTVPDTACLNEVPSIMWSYFVLFHKF